MTSSKTNMLVGVFVFYSYILLLSLMDPTGVHGNQHLLTFAMVLLLCLRHVTDTKYGQSAGAITTPASCAQVTWKEVVHSFSEHWMQAPRFWLADLLWQKTHFCSRKTREEST